jgi:hypothetical protein
MVLCCVVVVVVVVRWGWVLDTCTKLGVWITHAYMCVKAHCNASFSVSLSFCLSVCLSLSHTHKMHAPSKRGGSQVRQGY